MEGDSCLLHLAEGSGEEGLDSRTLCSEHVGPRNQTQIVRVGDKRQVPLTAEPFH